MQRNRHTIVLTLLVLAVASADRVATAAPQLRPQTGCVASRVMERLTVSLCRVVPSVAVIEQRREESPTESGAPPPRSNPVCRAPLSPFQFRLPPPTL